MGLDMYLYASKYISGWSHRKEDAYDKIVELVGVTPTPDSPSVTVRVTIGYWRKQNAIHNWFVQETQDGRDECQESWVDPDQLEELRQRCRAVLDDPSKAEELLPTQGGFFFGSTDYDEWYRKGLESTIEIIDRALAMEGVDFYYRASW